MISTLTTTLSKLLARKFFQVFEQIISLLGVSVVDIKKAILEYGSTRMTGSHAS